MNKLSRKKRRNVRHRRVRRKLKGTASVPRLSVFKSTKHIYAQIIDDSDGHTIVSASSLSPGVKNKMNHDELDKVQVAKVVGMHIAELSLSEGVSKINFDRGGCPFHGRVKSLAEGAREAGLDF